MSDPYGELVDHSRRGDTAAFAKLVAETQGRVYSLAYGVLGNREEAQDVSQEIYLRVWRALPHFRGDAKFSTWLYRVGINTCLNRRRQLRAQLGVVDDQEVLRKFEAPDGHPLTTTIEREQRQALWETVGRLPEKYRLVIILFYQHELTYREIADLLSLPLGTVKAHLNRARQALAKLVRLPQEAGDVPL